MAAVTCKAFTYAKYSSGGAGSAMVYTGGTMLDDYLAKVDINESRGDAKEYADGHLIDSEAVPTEVTMALELVNNNETIMKDVLGLAQPEANGDLVLTEADAPFVGAGCIIQDRYKGVSTYRVYWIYKAQFVSGGVSSSTRRDTTAWEHETITGTGVLVKLSADGAPCYYAVKAGLATEAAAIAWLKSKAGIT